jgi:hypothetical protein
MPDKFAYDAVVVGAGPNGLAAAIRMAQAKLSVLLLEANDAIGGGTCSKEITLPGFVHDLCSAIHPMALGSPFFRQLPLEKYGLTWVHPEFPLAHPLDDGMVAILRRSVQDTAAELGNDKTNYERWMLPLLPYWESLASEFLQPPLHFPRHPCYLPALACVLFNPLINAHEGGSTAEPARALFAGLAAHSFLPLEQAPSAAFGLVLGLMGHAVGWPLARGGSQQIANALAACLRKFRRRNPCQFPVETLAALPPARAILLDVTPRQLLKMAAILYRLHIASASSAFVMVQEFSKWTTLCLHRSPGKPKNAVELALCTWVELSRKLRLRTRESPPGTLLHGLSYSWLNRPFLITHERR